MAAKKYLKYDNGDIATQSATVVSTGATNDGDLLALDSSGKIDVSVLPTGVGPEVAILVATEALNGGDYVNIWNDAGTPKVRLADNSNGRRAHGYVKASVSISANATVYFEGDNDSLSSLVAGGDVYLGTAGGVIQTPLTESAAAGSISQKIGVARAATIVSTDIDKTVIKF